MFGFGFFLYDILNRFNKICNNLPGKTDYIEKYEKIKESLKIALNTKAWDGEWYKRAFTDNGKVLGSRQNSECKIDCIAQSWAAISKAGDEEKTKKAMESLEKHLIDKEAGIIKLLDPPFEKSDLEPGYIKSYLPGVRENGGQYTHSAIWAIIAFSILNLNKKAIDNYKMINPIEHSRSREKALLYKVEPYVIAADVYGVQDLLGQGGWTWYTGSSSWFYKAGIEYILGLKIKNGMLSISPCIPKEWSSYSIKYEYKTSIYNINIINVSKREPNEVKRFKVNGEEITEKQIKLIDNGKIYEIEVEL